MPANNKTQSLTKRHEIDPVFKEVLTFRFGQLDIPIQTQVEVSRLPRTMDALVILKPPGDLEKVSTETAFSYFRLPNQIELKGKEDALTLSGYRLILGRANLYLGENNLSAKGMTVTIISARKPRKVLYQCQDDVRWEKVGPGHYVSTELLPVHLFVCDELVIEPKNYPLLLFAASKKKLRQFFERIVSENNTFYIYYAHFADEKLIKEVLEMAGKESAYRKTREQMARDYLFPSMTPEERVRGLTPEERLRLLVQEDILRLLDPEIQEKLTQLVNNLDGKQTLSAQDDPKGRS